MLGRRRRRWPTIKPTLPQRYSSTGYLWKQETCICMATHGACVADVAPAMSQHWHNVSCFCDSVVVSKVAVSRKTRFVYLEHYTEEKCGWGDGLNPVRPGLHSAISECHSHPLRFCVALTHIQHQRSLSSVTSPSANQQPAVHKWATSGEVDRDWPVVFKCTPAHPLPTHGNLCTQCSSYKPEGIHECSTFNFIFIDN